jgi:hypothetical protein
VTLTPEQHAAVAQLAATDRHVRAHEQAHLAAAGPYATSAASYTLVTGPDGQQYAVGGEVHLDASPILGDPQATIAKARVIEAAANAPVDPSPQDRAVASAATAMEQAAAQELAKQRDTSAAASRVNSAYAGGSEMTASRLSLQM